MFLPVCVWMKWYMCIQPPHEITAHVMLSHASCDCMVVTTFIAYTRYIYTHFLILFPLCVAHTCHTGQHYYHSRYPFILYLHILPTWFSSSQRSVAGAQWQRRFWSCGGWQSNRVSSFWTTQILWGTCTYTLRVRSRLQSVLHCYTCTCTCTCIIMCTCTCTCCTVNNCT